MNLIWKPCRGTRGGAFSCPLTALDGFAMPRLEIRGRVLRNGNQPLIELMSWVSWQIDSSTGSVAFSYAGAGERGGIWTGAALGA